MQQSQPGGVHSGSEPMSPVSSMQPGATGSGGGVLDATGLSSPTAQWHQLEGKTEQLESSLSSLMGRAQMHTSPWWENMLVHQGNWRGEDIAVLPICALGRTSLNNATLQLSSACLDKTYCELPEVCWGEGGKGVDFWFLNLLLCFHAAVGASNLSLLSQCFSSWWKHRFSGNWAWNAACGCCYCCLFSFFFFTTNVVGVMIIFQWDKEKGKKFNCIVFLFSFPKALNIPKGR